LTIILTWIKLHKKLYLIITASAIFRVIVKTYDELELERELNFFLLCYVSEWLLLLLMLSKHKENRTHSALNT
jgi:acyl-CoA thioesterase